MSTTQTIPDACGNSIIYTLNTTNYTAVIARNQAYFANPLIIPNTVTYNGNTYAVTGSALNGFIACYFPSVTFPTTPFFVGQETFRGCSCPSVIVVPDNVTLTSYGIFARSNIPGCVLPSTATTIGNAMFEYTGFGQFSFPNNLTRIPALMFFNAAGPTNVIIPNSVTYIDDRAFYNCGNVRTVDMSNSVTGVHASAFENCYNLTRFSMSTSLTSCPVLKGCSSLPNIVLPSSVTYIPDSAFYNCTSLSYVTIQGPVTYIGNNAFTNCSNLLSFSIPATVSSIGNNAFYLCPKITNFWVDPSNSYYFSDSSGVLFNKAKTTLLLYPAGNTNASYDVPSTVTTINYNSFVSCANLTTARIYSPVISILDYAFDLSVKLGSVIIDSSSVTFGFTPFNRSSNFKNVYFTYPTPPKITVNTLLTAAQQSTVTARYPKTTTQDASYNAVLRAAGFTNVLSYPLPNAVISSVFSDISNNYIDISGTNLMDAATITVNGTTQPTSFNVVNNNLIIAYFQTNTQVSSISVADNFGNASDTYQLPSPILTTKPTISTVQLNSTAELTFDISGTYLNQVTGIAVNDLSANIVSKTDNLITGSMNALSRINTITLFAGTTAVLRQTVNLSTYPKSTPVIDGATVDSSNTLFITGTSFLNLKLVELINFGSVYQSFNNSQFDICGNTLLRINLSSRLKLSASIRVTDNYNVVSNLFSPYPRVISCTCFPEKTPIRTDQGLIAIDEINPEKHTIRKKAICAITQTIHPDKYLICFEKNALGNNIPCEKTIISRDHGIFYNGKMRKAKAFVNEFPNVSEVPYNGEVLYNVLMEEHDKMMVNNLICETLNPENGIAKYYRILPSLTLEEQHEFVKKVNSRAIKTSAGSSKKITK